MSLPTLSFLHIGDVHWPGLLQSKSALDLKDKGFSPGVSQRITTDPATVVRRRLLVEIPKTDAVLLMGDLTTKGELDAYQAFLDQLRRWVEEGGMSSVDRVHLVCGNHDIKRKDHSEQDIYAKFQPLNQALQERSFRTLPTRDPHVHMVSTADCTSLVISMNSCIGCGVIRHLQSLQVAGEEPDKVREAISGDSILLYENLDTPAFDEEQLHHVVSAIQDAGDKALPIVFAHHNILPQAVPRVEPYTELMNSGLVRGKLALTNRPVIYLHGHIHTDPVEVLTFPDSSQWNSKLVCISAPELAKGFNVLKVHFNAKGYPIGLTVLKWRYDQSCLEMACMEQRIPLWNNGFAAKNKMSSEARSFFGKLPKDECRVSELPEQTGENDLSKIADWLQELKWFGLVVLDDSDSDIRCWSVRGTLL